MILTFSVLASVVAGDQVGATGHSVYGADCLAAWATALGTILLAIVAVWQGRISSWLFGPKLRIILPELQGTWVERNNGVETWYYHLIVKNLKPSSAKGCRVTLRRMERRGPDGRFKDLRVPTALQFVWSHPQFTPPSPTIAIDRTLDLCFVDQGTDRLLPAMYSYPNNFDGYVKADECFRYYLDIEADNFTSKASQVIEVAWNGEWVKDAERMSQNVTIVAVNELSSGD